MNKEKLPVAAAYTSSNEKYLVRDELYHLCAGSVVQKPIDLKQLVHKPKTRESAGNASELTEAELNPQPPGFDSAFLKQSSGVFDISWQDPTCWFHRSTQRESNASQECLRWFQRLPVLYRRSRAIFTRFCVLVSVLSYQLAIVM
uniref:Uncharacterized protein n=1 Tax=Steinernema glaseri TaxID=37863 RepID=A0A1I8AAI9_9BILA